MYPDKHPSCIQTQASLMHHTPKNILYLSSHTQTSFMYLYTHKHPLCIQIHTNILDVSRHTQTSFMYLDPHKHHLCTTHAHTWQITLQTPTTHHQPSVQLRLILTMPSVRTLSSRVMWSTYFECKQIVGPFPSCYFLNCVLVVLLILHAYWFSLIVTVAYTVLSKQGEVSTPENFL